MSQADQPYLTVNWRDPVTGARGYLALHVPIRGLSAGGCRVRPGLTMDEISRLARVMTHKFTLFEVPLGGGKCGLDYDPAAPDMPDVLARFFAAIRPFLREAYITGEDMGTDEELILQTLERAGLETTADAAIHTWGTSPNVINTIPEAVRLDAGGLPLASLVTGYGVSESILEALAGSDLSPRGTRAAVQGFGSVGGATAHYLHEAGVSVVAIADAGGTVFDTEGLDVPHLLAHRSNLGLIDREALPGGARQLERDDWLTTDCEVLVPAAISDAVALEAARGIKDTVRIVAEGANMPLSDEAERFLHERGLFIVPDFLANSAFALIFSAVMLEWVGADKDAIYALVSDRLRAATRSVLEGFERGEFPRDVAVRIAEANQTRFVEESP